MSLELKWTIATSVVRHHQHTRQFWRTDIAGIIDFVTSSLSWKHTLYHLQCNMYSYIKFEILFTFHFTKNILFLHLYDVSTNHNIMFAHLSLFENFICLSIIYSVANSWNVTRCKQDFSIIYSWYKWLSIQLLLLHTYIAIYILF